MMLLVAPLLMLAVPGLGYRTVAGGGDLATRSPALAGVEQFQDWASTHCSDCGLTLGTLFQGIDSAQFLKSSTWQGNTLTVTLTEDNLYGEIAAPSKVPIMWKLGHEISMEFTTSEATGETTAHIDGLWTEPAPQGLDLYAAAMEHSKLDPTACSGGEECVDAELKAAGKYLSDKWGTIKKQEGKISRVMKQLYGKNAVYVAIRSRGAEKWGEIFYTMMMQGSNRVTGLVFKDGRVYALHTPVPFPRYEEYHGPEKMRLVGQRMVTANAGKSQAIAEQFARSSINFGLMMGYARNKQIYEERDVAPAKVAAIANLFRWCEGTKASELPKCKGATPGRVGWAPSPKP